MVQLPFDIYEKIIAFLSDDIGPLKCCSLACRTFAELSQRHIFSSIEFKPSSRTRTRSERRSKKFERILDVNPSIGGYVRSLSYIASFDQNKAGPRLPQRLRRVNKFSLVFPEDPGDWPKLPNYFKHSIYSFIQSNSIVELSLFNIRGLPVAIILHCPCLKILDMRHVHLCDVPLPDRFGGSYNTLKLIEFWCQDSPIGPLQKLLGSPNSGHTPALDMSDLEVLKVLVDNWFINMDFVISLISASQKLRCISLTGSYPDIELEGNLMAKLAQPSLGTLNTIELLPVLENVRTDPYLHFVPELELFGGKNVLETLFIGVHIQTNRRCTTELSKWTVLDHTLSRRGAFPFLRSVTLKIIIYDLSGGFEPFQAALEDIGRNAFPGLRDNKNIKFTFDVTVEDI